MVSQMHGFYWATLHSCNVIHTYQHSTVVQYVHTSAQYCAQYSYVKIIHSWKIFSQK